MTDFLINHYHGAVQALLATATISLLGWWGVRYLLRQPIHRVFWSTCTMLATLGALLLCALPAIWKIPVVTGTIAVQQTAEVPPATGKDDSSLIVASPVTVLFPNQLVMNENAPMLNGIPQIAVPPGEKLKNAHRLQTLAPKQIDEKVQAGYVAAPPALKESTQVTWWHVVVAIYLVGLLVGAVRMIWAAVQVQRIWKHSLPIPPVYRARCEEIARTLTLRKYDFHVSHVIRGASCFGIWKPRVVLSLDLLFQPQQLEGVIRHEVSHLERKDPARLLLAGVYQTVFWIFPWGHWLVREMRVAQEMLADRLALGEKLAPVAYAEMLLMYSQAGRMPALAMGMSHGRSQLYRRIEMLVKSEKKMQTKMSKLWRGVFAGVVGTTALVLGGIALQPTTEIVAAPPAPKKEEKEAPKVDAPKPPVQQGEIRDDFDKMRIDLEKMQAEMMQRIQQLMQKMPQQPGVAAPVFPGGGVQGRIIINGPNGMQAFNPFAPIGGQGRLGITVDRPNETLINQLDLPVDRGLIAKDVPAQSVAGKAGIKPHDIILEVNGKAVPNDPAAFKKNIDEIKPDTAVDIVVLRKGKKETIKDVKLPEVKEEPMAAPFPGIQVIPINPGNLPGGFAPVFPVPPVVAPPIPAFPQGANIAQESMQVQISGDSFTAIVTSNGVKVSVAGSKETGSPVADSIVIEDNGKTTTVDSMDKVPAQYKPLAEKALKGIK